MKKVITILAVVYILILVGSVYEGKRKATQTEETFVVLLDTAAWYNAPATVETVSAALIVAGVRFPEIALAQAVLETGWFTSHNCKERNNLFGLYNSYKGHFFQYHSWYGSIVGEDRDGKHYPGYVDIQKRYKGGDDVEEYLQWLERIGYAEDTTYVRKIRKLIK